jgi:two-component system response regulator PilR (NtrC family)
MARVVAQPLIERSLTGAWALRGRSTAMASVRIQASFAAKTRVPVLITGETGTGKSLVAHCIHTAARGDAAPFVTVFSPAHDHSDLLALFQSAAGGSFLIEEVSELEPTAQDLLLGLTRRSAERRGAESGVRILATSRADLAALARAGRFSDELRLALGGVRIELPPLRARQKDLRELGEICISRALHRGLAVSPSPPRLTARALGVLAEHPWPGNVLELENVLERALAVTRGETLDEDAIRQALGAAPRPASNDK